MPPARRGCEQLRELVLPPLGLAGGAVAGALVGNEVQKRVTAKEVWVTRVKMKDGSIQTFEQEAKPNWAVGSVVKVQDKSIILQ